ncbi:hypothetical protein I4U23_024251 [Adineta vaga]|nr:hypothetical protein I4U23_024251 [Adineta vaga]
MNDLTENMGLDGSYNLPAGDGIIDQTLSASNVTINNTLMLSFNQNSEANNEALRLLLLTIAIIIVLVCITISTVLRRNSKRHRKQDHLLIPEQSEKISRTTSSEKKKPKPTKTSQFSGKSNVPSSSMTINEKIPIGPFYYDNLDDIPYIDESRPTISVNSVIFVNLWNTCVDVSVEENIFPISLIQSSDYHQVCPSREEHWRRFGSSLFRMHILRTAEPLIDRYIELQHNGYVHLHNESKITVAKWYGAEHQEL